LPFGAILQKGEVAQVRNEQASWCPSSMLDSSPHTAVGGVLAQIAGAVERLSLESTPASLLQATARELQERLGARTTIISRRERPAL